MCWSQRARCVDLLLIRATPYLPAAVSIATTRGLIHDRIHYTKWADAFGVDRYGSEIIVERVGFLSRSKSGEGEDPELLDHEDRFSG